MNPLRQRLQPVQQTQMPGRPSMGQLMDMIKTTNPLEAKAQVEQIVKERGISQEEFNSYKQQAMQICQALGIK